MSDLSLWVCFNGVIGDEICSGADTTPARSENFHAPRPRERPAASRLGMSQAEVRSLETSGVLQ